MEVSSIEVDEVIAAMALTKVPKVGSILAKNLISYCGSARAVFEASKKQLIQVPGIGNAITHAIKQQTCLAWAEKEYEFTLKNEIRVLYYLDHRFPQRLHPCPDSPIILYQKGKVNLNHQRMLAVVGTRKPSIHGIAFCEELISDLAQHQIQVISGLALGIDITAHRACLQNRIPTIGVLGHGLDRVYPARHTNTAYQMLDHGGLISEFPSNTGPEREHFPMRNRVVAGLCDALIVIETDIKGGSMITARLANDYHKDVFAVPGRVKDRHVKGCNFLIKSHRAALLEHAEDLLKLMNWDGDKKPVFVQQQLFEELSTVEKLIVDLLRKNEELTVDTIQYQTKLKASEIANILLNLEFSGIIKALPGKRYTIVA